MICSGVLTCNVYGLRLLGKVICTYVLLLGLTFRMHVFTFLLLLASAVIEYVAHVKAPYE